MSAPPLDPAASAATILAALVAIDSRNPTLAPGAPGEAAIADAVGGFLRAAGLEVTRVEPGAGRPSILGRLLGRGGGRGLLLNGHLDTVGFGGMVHPLVPREADGRLHGRGAYDMKAGVAAILAASAALARGPALAGDVWVMAVSDEEYASAGTEAALAALAAASARPAGAVVTEPTDLRLCLAHKGFAWATFTTTGRAAHGSRRADGVDAIAHMGRVLGGLEALDVALQTRPPHPLLGHGSLHASLIAGGTELSTYPAACQLQVERRTLPGETPAGVLAEFQAILDGLRAADPQFQATVTLAFDRPPLETPANDPLAVALAAAAAANEAAPGPPVGATFWMDAALIGAAGIPTVAYGPAGAGLHADVEWADLASVETCAAVLAATARAFCG